MANADPEAPATYYRLTPDIWAEIGEAYKRGATARTLAQRWKVSPSSIYRHAGAQGWTKRDNAELMARESMAEDAARTADVAERRAALDEAIAAVFATIAWDPDGTPADPAELGNLTLGVSGMALQHGDYPRAREFARLSELYFRIAPETWPTLLTVVADAVINEQYADRLFARGPDDKNKLKERHWRLRSEARKKADAEAVARRKMRDRLAAYEQRYGPLEGGDGDVSQASGSAS